MLDLVPLAGAWRGVADVDGDVERVSNTLELLLSDVRAVADHRTLQRCSDGIGA